ncbi:hypothetical protein FFLO_05225 [Filobasidium floriforme]|uniref:Uncharacterized protein n=1 Tax=Filobasidium floriforme TaxID=5210 RepID=A0A8K0JJH1_9TREE|nr:uncharacterized protein HD553DRAFT_334351 [Filobasidium floriforme]KAG7530177.1 hypothetical protein FFLO_05225 [Filobasidium floriforme]KAH8087241.1 hypothetical protein HD553DRAFT_334351 [Filobasidium floriforme]
MSDISTLGSALNSFVSDIWKSVPPRLSIEEMRDKINSVPCTICAAMSVPEASLNTDIITVTTTESPAQQPDPGREQEPSLSHKQLLETLDKIPKTIPKGMKWGDLGWYLIAAEACVFAVGYAYSTLTGRSLIVTWTGELPPSQLKPGDAESLTPHVELEVCKEREWLAVSHFVKGEWVRKTYHVAANLVHTPTSPVAHDSLDNHELPERSHSGASSDADLSELLVLTPPGSDTSGDDPAATNPSMATILMCKLKWFRNQMVFHVSPSIYNATLVFVPISPHTPLHSQRRQSLIIMLGIDKASCLAYSASNLGPTILPDYSATASPLTGISSLRFSGLCQTWPGSHDAKLVEVKTTPSGAGQSVSPTSVETSGEDKDCQELWPAEIQKIVRDILSVPSFPTDGDENNSCFLETAIDL